MNRKHHFLALAGGLVGLALAFGLTLIGCDNGTTSSGEQDGVATAAILGTDGNAYTGSKTLKALSLNADGTSVAAAVKADIADGKVTITLPGSPAEQSDTNEDGVSIARYVFSELGIGKSSSDVKNLNVRWISHSLDVMHEDSSAGDKIAAGWHWNKGGEDDYVSLEAFLAAGYKVFALTDEPVTWTAVQTGGVSGTTPSKAIVFTFSAPVSGLTLDDITITPLENGNINVGTLTKTDSDGKVWTLTIKDESVEDVDTIHGAIEGAVAIAFEKWGIDRAARDVAVYTHVTMQSRPSNTDHQNWMRYVRDNVLIRDMSIPGTHDSATKGVKDITAHWSRTQDKTIWEQLEDGIRYLDIRVNENGNIFHGTTWKACWTGWTFDGIVNECIKYLDSHPKEVILMSIQDETTDGTGSQKSSAVTHIKNKMNATSSHWIYTDDGGTNDYSTTDGENFKTMTLGSARGKIIAVSSCSYLGRGIGFNDSNATKYQNEWEEEHVVDKVAYIANFLALSYMASTPAFAPVLPDYTRPLLLNGWNNQADWWPCCWSVKDWAKGIEKHFYGAFEYSGAYYPRGIQIMDYYNVDLVYEVYQSNRTRGLQIDQ